MKKILVGLLTLASVSAFAQKHMVQLGGYENARGAGLDRTLDLYNTSGGSTHNTTYSYALNYAYAITPAWQIGAEFRKYDAELAAKATDEAIEYGIFGIYNLAGRLTDTTYVGAKYLLGNRETRDQAGNKSADDDSMTLAFELGHRFLLGTLWGMQYNWSPNLSLGIIALDPDQGGDASRTELSFNVLKVDVLF